MWHTLFFETVHKIKGLFLVWTLGGLFLAFQMRLLKFVLSLLILHFFFLQSQVLATLANWYLILVAWLVYVKINHQILLWLMRQIRDEYKSIWRLLHFFKNKYVWLGLFYLCVPWSLKYNFCYIATILLIFYYTCNCGPPPLYFTSSGY